MTDHGRRDFIKKLGGCAVLAVVAPGVDLGEAFASSEEYDMSEHRYAYVVDTTKCIGCGMCVQACARENQVPDGYYRTWVERYTVRADGVAEIDSPNGGIEGFHPTSTLATLSFFVPKLCNHCANTPCTQVCPVGASYTTEDGVVLVDYEHCIGCGYCVQACPYGSRFLHPETHMAAKCSLCYHRITKGMKPACVEVCPAGARMFGDLKQPGSPMLKYLQSTRTTVLKPELLTKPSIQYVGLSKEVK